MNDSVLLLAFLSTTMMTRIAIFGGVTALALWALEMMSKKKPRAEERLEELSEPTIRREGGNSKGAVTMVLEKASPALSAPLQPKTSEEVSQTRGKLNMAGFRSENAPEIFWSMKMIGLIVGFVAGGGVGLFVKGMTPDTATYAGLGAGLAFFLPEIVVALVAKSRKDNIFYGLPDALDLMVVCVEAGLGLDQAMRKVSEEMKKTYHVISEEFALCNMQLQMGRARNEVLHDLGMRTGVDDLKSLAAILIQADKFGSSVAQALRVQSDSMRTKRRQMAEEKAAKTAVKLIFPLVIFIFPAIFIVLVGPAAITMINELFPSMQGAQ
ncbi:MAG: type II secretion system F family protein [Planctomycetota bacterium]